MCGKNLYWFIWECLCFVFILKDDNQVSNDAPRLRVSITESKLSGVQKSRSVLIMAKEANILRSRPHRAINSK